MDLASVVAALASVGVRVSGSAPNSSVQVDSSRACPTGLAGPEPSGTFHDPGQHFQKLDVVWCGPYKILEVLNKGENVKLDIPAPFDGLRVLNRDSIKPYVHREGQPVWEFPVPPVKTGESPRLVKIVARRRVGSQKRRTFLYLCE